LVILALFRIIIIFQITKAYNHIFLYLPLSKLSRIGIDVL